jgi:hypothetical protein
MEGKVVCGSGGMKRRHCTGRSELRVSGPIDFFRAVGWDFSFNSRLVCSRPGWGQFCGVHFLSRKSRCRRRWVVGLWGCARSLEGSKGGCGCNGWAAWWLIVFLAQCEGMQAALGMACSYCTFAVVWPHHHHHGWARALVGTTK